MTSAVYLEELRYAPDSCELFDRLRNLPGSVFFDSAYPHSNGGRYDIMTACPMEVDTPMLANNASEQQSKSYFADLAHFHHEHFQGVQPAAQDIPFCGGIMGYLEYDAGSGLNKLNPHRQPSDSPSPAFLQAYEWAVIQDHLLHRAVLVALPSVSPKRRSEIRRLLRQPRVNSTSTFSLSSPFVSNLSAHQYKSAFEQIHRYIQSGDCYQVNLAQRFSAPFEGSPWDAYRQLRAVAAAPFSAYITLPDGGTIMSLSPERFISVHGRHVETSPIKGTRPRQQDYKADRLEAQALINSKKDRAENLMIVDLLRNDLGRSCVPGTIHVDRLFELKSFPTVHHLVSTISGELRPERDVWQLLRDSFPGGSITGAPKRRAMEIISELEPHPRQVYCGSMVYVSADGRMDSNIAIRTLQCRDGVINCWGGGGIVADSQWALEYAETYDKVGKFLQHLEQMNSPAQNT
ncbi:MAG: para-aminobenzoate synthetase component 1 [Halioglobus sp.]|jgi:para-aminobenzoate synthetase component 1